MPITRTHLHGRHLYPPHPGPVGYRKLLRLFAITHPDQLDRQGHLLAQDWGAHYHLSTLRYNLLQPFCGLLTNRYVLEVGAGSGLITRQLAQWARRVVALEPNARLLQLARLRTRDLSHVDWHQKLWTEFSPERLFDVVVVPDGLPEQWEGLLEQAYAWLAPHGCLLLATPNPWGLRYQRQYALARPGHPSPYRQLLQMAQRIGFARSGIYLPFPSHRLPGSLITPEGLGEPRFQAGELVMMQGYLDRRQPPVTGQVAAHRWLDVFEQGMGADRANSFLLVAHCQQPTSLPEEEVLAYHYHRWGPEDTQFIRDRSGDLWVEKQAPGVDQRQLRQPYLRGQLLMARLAMELGNTHQPEAVLDQFIATYAGILQQLSGLPRQPIMLDQPVIPSLVDAHPGNIVLDKSGQYHSIDSLGGKGTATVGMVLLTGLVAVSAELHFPARWPQWVSLEDYLARALIRTGLFGNRTSFERYLRQNRLSVPWVRVQLIPAYKAMPPVLRPVAWVAWRLNNLANALARGWPGLKRIFWQLRARG